MVGCSGIESKSSFWFNPFRHGLPDQRLVMGVGPKKAPPLEIDHSNDFAHSVFTGA